MIKVVLDVDHDETGFLRDVYRDSVKERGLVCGRIDKMGRVELTKKLKALIASGDIVIQDGEDADKPSLKNAESQETSGIRYPMKHSVNDCFNWLMEAIRLYMKVDVWVNSGRREDPQTKKYLNDAREAVRKAVGCAIKSNGEGWDNANKAAYVLDRAILNMRNDFNDTLVANCIVASLMSDKHQAEMEKIRGKAD